MASETGKQIITIYILPNISGSKYSHTKKFGKFIEYNMRRIFLENSYTESGGETSPRPFSKNQN